MAVVDRDAPAAESTTPGSRGSRSCPTGQPAARTTSYACRARCPTVSRSVRTDRLYVGYEPTQVLRVDLTTREVTTVLADATAHLLCQPANLAFRGDPLFTSNLGGWHITLVEDLDLGR